MRWDGAIASVFLRGWDFEWRAVPALFPQYAGGRHDVVSSKSPPGDLGHGAPWGHCCVVRFFFFFWRPRASTQAGEHQVELKSQLCIHCWGRQVEEASIKIKSVIQFRNQWTSCELEGASCILWWEYKKGENQRQTLDCTFGTNLLS